MWRASASFWWSARHPGVSQVCAKRDVKRAFKWHAVRPTDTADFGARLPSQTSEVKGYLLLIYCVLTFGWRGSPGEYMVFSWG